MDNKIYTSGDSIIIEVKPKQKGNAIITGYVDELINITNERNVFREYRIIEDELFYTDWKELSNDSINGIVIKQNNTIQIRYTRIGKDETSFIEFKSIEFKGDFEPEIINSPILNNSMFSNVAWTDKTEKLAKNLFKKLYFRGIIPTYILRGDNVDVKEDEDYVALFYTIAKFYAIIICFFQRFESFFKDEELMTEWIRQNGICFNESDIKLEELQYIARHLYNEIRNRGTNMIFSRQGDVVNNVIKEIDGEFIRLIRSTPKDELLYENIPFSKLGWCLGQSSPLYRGTAFSTELNKTREKSQDFIDLNNFQSFAQRNSTLSIIEEKIEDIKIVEYKNKTIYTEDCKVGSVLEPQLADYKDFSVFEANIAGGDKIVCNVNNETSATTIIFIDANNVVLKIDNQEGVLNNKQIIAPYNSYKVFILSHNTSKIEIYKFRLPLQLKTTGKSVCGLGRYEDEKITNIYTADPDLDYEITFMFKVDLIGKNATLNFGVEMFNNNMEKINGTIKTDNSEVTEMFLNKLPLNKFKENQWYFVRGIIHAYSSDVIENIKLNIGFGNQLTFNNKFVKFMLPRIFITSDNSTVVSLWDYKIRPLVRGTHILPLRNGKENSYSLGFIQAPRIFYAYFRNNNNSQSQQEITDIIERYLLPYNMTSILQFINN